MLTFLTGDPNTPGEFPDKLHQLIARYADSIRLTTKYAWTKSVNHEIFGVKDCHDFKVENDLLLLMFFLLFAYIEKEEALETSDCDNEVRESIREKYQFDCIRKYFKCYGIDSKKLEAIFGLSEDPENGIGYMQIEGDGNCKPIFKVG